MLKMYVLVRYISSYIQEVCYASTITHSLKDYVLSVNRLLG